MPILFFETLLFEIVVVGRLIIESPCVLFDPSILMPVSLNEMVFLIIVLLLVP